MEAVVVPHFEINFHVLSGHDAEAVHVETIEERGACLFQIQGHRFDDFLFYRFLHDAIEGQLAETVVVGDKARKIDIGGKLLIERLHADVGIGIGQHVDGEG